MRFGESKFEQKEPEEIIKFKNFLIENLPAVSAETLKNKKAGELFDLYQNLINEEASFENFKKFLLNCASETEKEVIQGLAKGDIKNDILVSDAYRKYLLMKLPQELQERQEQISEERNEPEIPIERLDSIHGRRSEDRMVLGFHTSNKDIGDKIEPSKIESVTIAANEEIIVPSGFTHYTLNPKGLYSKRTKYLYLVEGSASDLKTTITREYSEAHKDSGWIAAARPLPIITKIELNDEIIKEIGLGFKI